MLTANEVLAGIGSPALITLVGLFVLSNGLLHSGALDRLRELLATSQKLSKSKAVNTSETPSCVLKIVTAMVIGRKAAADD